MPEPTPHPDTDEAWHDLLRQWRARPAPQPRPFFYGRVRARLADAAAAERQLLPAWLRWPSYAAMLGITLLLSGDGAALPSATPAGRPPADLTPTAWPAR